MKRWTAGAVAAILFAVIGWQMAKWVAPREALPQRMATQATRYPSRRGPMPVRSIARPEPIVISEARLPNVSLWTEMVGAQHTPSTDSSHPAIRIVTGFESSPTVTVTRVSDTHWLIENERHFFLFHVEGATGQTLTFETVGTPDNRWAVINPVYSYAQSLDDLAAFASAPVASPRLRQASNGAQLPDTSGQGWQYIEDTQMLDQRLWFRQRFDKDAYVCVRYPYTPSYHQRYLDSLTNNPAVSVITVGRSREGRPLRVVKIGAGTETDERSKPCALIYAREYACEQEASWVAQGAMDFLISDAPEAKQARQTCTFLVIPMLDPDGAAHSVYINISPTFISGLVSLESAAYSEFFKHWADQGKPLQLVFNLMEGRAAAHLWNTNTEPDANRRNYTETYYRQFLVPTVEAAGLRILPNVGKPNVLNARLGNWLRASYGTLHVPFEVNGQERDRHLTILELRRMGALLASSAAHYLASRESAPLIADVKWVRNARDARWAKYRDVIVARNAIDAELRCLQREQRVSSKTE